MSSAKLRRYIFYDHRRRLRDDRIGILLALFAAIMVLFVGQSERTATIAAVVTLFAFMTFSTLSYCWGVTQSTSAAGVKSYAFLYQPVTSRLAFISALIILALTPLPGVEAAILDRRLRNLLSRPLDDRSVEELTNTLTTVVQRRIKIPEATAKSIDAALKPLGPSVPDQIRRQAEQASALTFLADLGWPPGMAGPVYDTNKQLAGRTWGFVAIATNTGPDSYQTIGVTDNPADVAIMLRLSDSQPEFTFGPAFFVAKGMKATLDGWHLKHIVFQDMALTYNGGSVILDGVCFLGCRFEFVKGASTERLVAQIKNRGWTNFTMS